MPNTFASYEEPSMEPRPLSHGYNMPLHKFKYIWQTFNGATASQPWIQLNNRQGAERG